MATLTFYNRTSIDKLAPVYLRLTDTGGVNIIVRTPFKMIPSYWNVKKQKCNDDITDNEIFSRADALKVEGEFYKLKDHLLKAYFDLREPVTAAWLTATVEQYFYKGAPPKVETLRQYLDRFYEEAKAGIRLATVGNSKRPFAYETLRSFKGTKLSFEMFMDETKRKSNFADITIDWYNDFLKFYYKRGCSANYIGRHIKTLKTVLRAAREEGLHHNTEIERRSFKAISEPSESIYLTEDEVYRMYSKDLTETPVLARARDIFLCGVYTAQRYSDYSRINKAMIKEEGGAKYIELTQQKTGEKCIIPVRPELDDILSRYDYTLPKSWEQKINDNIKLVGGKCEINEPITIESRKSGMRVTKTEPKCKFIKTHTARRTGCTLMYLAGVQPIDIMKVSGHKTEREFLKYIKVGKEQTAKNLSNHPYFKGNVLKVAN
jgi:integrase